MKRLFLHPHGLAAMLGLGAFLVYLRTLAPTVAVIDSGELAAVACTLGVAHPTGYPLFTLLGWVFSRLPIAPEEIVRLNIMSAFLCALGVYSFFHLCRFVLGFAAQRVRPGKGRAEETSSGLILAASAAGSMLLAFSETFWSTALSVEVYSLHVLFLSVVSLSFFKACLAQREDPQSSSGIWWMIFAFTLGLSFTNHMTTILLAPGFLYLYFATQGGGITSWKRIGMMGVPFLAGLSVYVYLPIRAAQNPTLNWGYTATLERFLWHVSGKQYRVWIFSSTEAAGRQFNYFLNSLPAEVAFIGLFLGLIGVFALWKAHRKLALTTIILFVSCVLYSINYDIHDIDSYFLLAYVCIALWSACGFFAIASWLIRTGKMAARYVPALAVAVALVPVVYNYHRVDESSNYLVEDYTMNMFASLDKNAVIFSFQWDYWLSASYYYQLVKEMRPDIAVVDKELLRRSWYLKELEHRYPWLIENSRREVDAFLEELYKFEHDIPYNPAVIQGRFVGMIASFIKTSMVDRPVFVTAEIEQEFTQGLVRIPQGLAFRVTSDPNLEPAHLVDFKFRPFGRSGRLEDMFPRLYASSLNASGVYYHRAGMVAEARQAFQNALNFDPTSVEARRWLQTIRPE